MGKLITYTSRPTGPRAAKVAWSQFETELKSAPQQMHFDVMTREWVAVCKGSEHRISLEPPKEE